MLDEIKNSKPARAVKALDREVLRQYSKVAKRWEDKGRDIYHLSSAVGISSLILIGITGNRFFDILGISSENFKFMYLFPACWDNVDNLHGLRRKRNEELSDSSTKAIYPAERFYTTVNRAIRLPCFLSGIGMVGKTVYDAYNYLLNGEPIALGEDFILAQTGLGFIGTASSMYLKDRDPKLLQKDPLWKRAYESAKSKYHETKEKIGELVPKPILEPAHARASYRNGLENYVFDEE